MAYGDYGFVYAGVGGLRCTTSSPYGEQQVWDYSDEDDTIGLMSKTVMANRGLRTGESNYTSGYEYDSTSKIASMHYSPSGLNEGYILDAGHNMVSRSVVKGGQAVSYGYAYGGTYTRRGGRSRGQIFICHWAWLTIQCALENVIDKHLAGAYDVGRELPRQLVAELRELRMVIRSGYTMQQKWALRNENASRSAVQGISPNDK